MDDGEEEDGSEPPAASTPSSGEVYSTEETRIGTWIDGKPLYRRVLSNMTVPSGSVSTTYDIGLNGTFAFAVNVRAIIYYNAGGLGWIQSNYVSAGGSFLAGLYENGSLWVLSTINATHNQPMTVILEYTKTTDGGDT